MNVGPAPRARPAVLLAGWCYREGGDTPVLAAVWLHDELRQEVRRCQAQLSDGVVALEVASGVCRFFREEVEESASGAALFAAFREVADDDAAPGDWWELPPGTPLPDPSADAKTAIVRLRVSQGGVVWVTCVLDGTADRVTSPDLAGWVDGAAAYLVLRRIRPAGEWFAADFDRGDRPTAERAAASSAAGDVSLGPFEIDPALAGPAARAPLRRLAMAIAGAADRQLGVGRLRRLADQIIADTRDGRSVSPDRVDPTLRAAHELATALRSLGAGPCDHQNNQACGDFVRCNDCGATWSPDEED